MVFRSEKKHDHILCNEVFLMMLPSIAGDQFPEFSRGAASRTCDNMFEVVQFFLLAFRFIRVTHRIERLIFKGGDRPVHHDDRVESGIDGIVMRDERV